MDAIFSPATPETSSPTDLSLAERAALRVAESAAISPAGFRDLTQAIVMELRAAGLLVVPADRSADTEYECPTCSVWSRWTRGRSIAEGDMADEFQCPSCGATTYLATCNIRTQAEDERLRKELAGTQEDLAFLHRSTLPELRRMAKWHDDGKKRWRARAEKAEARVAELTALLEQARSEARTANTVGSDR
jgi:predicted RNA-binding Zn-ribbon protein involved in translation (DUF1610 family)